MSLADDVRRLAECQAAANILHSFAAALDEPEADTVLQLFCPDAVLTVAGRTFEGHERIRSFFTKAWAADPSAKRHFVTSPRVTWLEPGLVRVEAYFYFVGRAAGQSVLGWGTYDDVVDVTGPEPRFARLQMESHLRTDLATGWAAKPPVVEQ